MARNPRSSHQKPSEALVLAGKVFTLPGATVATQGHTEPQSGLLEAPSVTKKSDWNYPDWDDAGESKKRMPFVIRDYDTRPTFEWGDWGGHHPAYGVTDIPGTVWDQTGSGGKGKHLKVTVLGQGVPDWTPELNERLRVLAEAAFHQQFNSPSTESAEKTAKTAKTANPQSPVNAAPNSAYDTFTVDPAPGRLDTDLVSRDDAPLHYSPRRGPIKVSPGKEKWMYLDGQVGFGKDWHSIPEGYAEEWGLSPREVQYIGNNVARNAIPHDREIAVGTLTDGYPVILYTTVDRNHVYDSVVDAGNRMAKPKSTTGPGVFRAPSLDHYRLPSEPSQAGGAAGGWSPPTQNLTSALARENGSHYAAGLAIESDSHLAFAEIVPAEKFFLNYDGTSELVTYAMSVDRENAEYQRDIRKIESNPQTVILNAVDEGKTIGSVWLAIGAVHVDWTGEGYYTGSPTIACVVQSLYVLPAYRNSPVVGLLMRRVKEIADQSGLPIKATYDNKALGAWVEKMKTRGVVARTSATVQWNSLHPNAFRIVSDDGTAYIEGYLMSGGIAQEMLNPEMGYNGPYFHPIDESDPDPQLIYVSIARSQPADTSREYQYIGENNTPKNPQAMIECMIALKNMGFPVFADIENNKLQQSGRKFLMAHYAGIRESGWNDDTDDDNVWGTNDNWFNGFSHETHDIKWRPQNYRGYGSDGGDPIVGLKHRLPYIYDPETSALYWGIPGQTHWNVSNGVCDDFELSDDEAQRLKYNAIHGAVVEHPDGRLHHTMWTNIDNDPEMKQKIESIVGLPLDYSRDPHGEVRGSTRYADWDDTDDDYAFYGDKNQGTLRGNSMTWQPPAGKLPHWPQRQDGGMIANRRPYIYEPIDGRLLWGQPGDDHMRIAEEHGIHCHGNLCGAVLQSGDGSLTHSVWTGGFGGSPEDHKVVEDLTGIPIDRRWDGHGDLRVPKKKEAGWEDDDFVPDAPEYETNAWSPENVYYKWIHHPTTGVNVWEVDDTDGWPYHEDVAESMGVPYRGERGHETALGVGTYRRSPIEHIMLAAHPGHSENYDVPKRALVESFQRSHPGIPIYWNPLSYGGDYTDDDTVRIAGWDDETDDPYEVVWSGGWSRKPMEWQPPVHDRSVVLNTPYDKKLNIMMHRRPYMYFPGEDKIYWGQPGNTHSVFMGMGKDGVAGAVLEAEDGSVKHVNWQNANRYRPEMQQRLEELVGLPLDLDRLGEGQFKQAGWDDDDYEVWNDNKPTIQWRPEDYEPVTDYDPYGWLDNRLPYIYNPETDKIVWGHPGSDHGSVMTGAEAWGYGSVRGPWIHGAVLEHPKDKELYHTVWDNISPSQQARLEELVGIPIKYERDPHGDIPYGGDARYAGWDDEEPEPMPDDEPMLLHYKWLHHPSIGLKVWDVPEDDGHPWHSEIMNVYGLTGPFGVRDNIKLNYSTGNFVLHPETGEHLPAYDWLSRFPEHDGMLPGPQTKALEQEAIDRAKQTWKNHQVLQGS